MFFVYSRCREHPRSPCGSGLAREEAVNADKKLPASDAVNPLPQPRHSRLLFKHLHLPDTRSGPFGSKPPPTVIFRIFKMPRTPAIPCGSGLAREEAVNADKKLPASDAVNPLLQPRHSRLLFKHLHLPDTRSGPFGSKPPPTVIFVYSRYREHPRSPVGAGLLAKRPLMPAKNYRPVTR